MNSLLQAPDHTASSNHKTRALFEIVWYQIIGYDQGMQRVGVGYA